MITGYQMLATRDDPPILVCADLQVEYLTEGRSHVVNDGEAIMARPCIQVSNFERAACMSAASLPATN